MPLVLFLIFIVVPIAEVAVFIEAGRLIGVVPTILLTIGTAIAGSVLMRIQGFTALTRLMQSLQRGEMPVTPVIDGIGILTAGVLLITPGLISDLIGLMLFIPPVRRGLAKWLFRKAMQSGTVHIRTYSRSQGAATRPGPKPGGRPDEREKFVRSENFVDAEFETIDPGEEHGGAANDNADGKHKRNSPWRKN